MVCPCEPQSLRLSYLWMPLVFWYSWFLSHVLSWTRKWAFRISELVSSVSLWSWLLDMMRLSTVDCSAYILGCLLWALLCQVLGAEHVCHKYFFDFHVCLYLDLMLGFMWVFACVVLFCRDWSIWIFVCYFILNENEWHIRYVFDPLMGVIKIFDGDGVWTFIFIQMV